MERQFVLRILFVALLHNIEQNTSRYFEIISSAIDEILPAADDDAQDVQDDVYDILHRHRLQQQQTSPDNDNNGAFAADNWFGSIDPRSKTS